MVKKIYKENNEDDDDSGHLGSSDIDFHLDLLSGEPRDDFLSPEELKRKLSVHHDQHYNLVKKQKQERKARQDLKEGKKVANQNHLQGTSGYGRDNGVKPHPTMAEKAYFSGMENKVTLNPGNYEAQTNEVKRNEHLHQLQLKNQLDYTHTPKFNPTPKPY